MATLKMSGCMKLVSKMSDADQDALLARLDQYQADGVPADRAQFMAAQDMLAEIQGERDSLFGLLQEQHPDLFTVNEEPADTAQMSRQRGVNVRNDGDNRYADLIVDGEKTMESRDTDSLRPYVGQTVGIIRTGEGPAKLIGSVKIGEPIEVDEQQFREMQSEHLVPAGSAFDIKPGRTKFLYPLTEAERFDDERDVETRGIVARDVQFSRARTPLGFYSALADSVDGIKTNSAPAQGWKDAIKGLVNKGQVKADEVEWSGVNDWLDLQQGRVSRDAVSAYLQQGGVQVEETVLRDSGDEIPFLDNAAKYSQYTLPGGENYREVLLTLPGMVSDAVARVAQEVAPTVEALPADSIGQTLPAMARSLAGRYGLPAIELEAALAQIRGGGLKTQGRYKSSHWDQPNVLAHIRVNDRTDADGKRVLFVEELQSDWGQAAKKSGFNDGPAEAPLVGPDERENLISLMQKRAQDRMIEVGVEAKQARDVANRLGHDMLADASGMREQYDDLIRREMADRDRELQRSRAVPRAPFIGKTEGWLNLALKRVMVMAAEGGYDKVAFVNGEQSADRYDLSKQVEDISYRKNSDGTYMLTATDKNGRVAMNEKSANEADIEGIVGKEIAQKIVAGEGKPYPKGSVSEGMTELSGLDLKVGGEGMKAFYDTIVPTALKKLLPKVGGGQIADVQIEIPGETNRIDRPRMEMLQQPGFDVTDAMRAKLEEGVPMFSRARPSVGVGRDELGYTNFGIGAMAYERASTIANNVLDALSNKTGGLVAFKPIDPKLNRAIRKMRVELEKTQNLTANVAQQLKDIPEDERKMISDVIEGELKVGVVPPQRVLQLAASMSQIMSQQSAELVRLGMLTPEAAQRWDNKYLPRFYEQKLGDEVKAWAKAAKTLFGRTRAMAGIRGNNLKARGMFETIDVAELANWQAQGWEIRDADYDPATSTDVRIWRDYTRDERDNMGEIRDAMFRFVMGYMNSQRDVALGRLYERLEADVASRTEKPGYVLVPKTLVEDTVARRYGKLAGKWVPREVMDHLSALDSSTENEVFQLYKKGLALWKEGKTVLNPVAHANNIISNLTMAHFAGVSYWDVHKYAGTVRDLMRNSVLVTEAKDAGLFGGTFNRAELVDELPPQLRMLAGMTESKLAKGGSLVWNAMSFFLRKPLGKAYDAEDKFFRFLIYREARGRGLDIDDAVDYAQRFIFTYDNLPKGARAVRDFGLPFFGYTYKAAPVLLRTAMEHPLRYAAPAAILTAANAAMYALASAADEDDDWAELLKRYVTDEEFRKKAQEMEADERKNLPEWMKGRSGVLGTPKTVRLWEDTVTGLPMFLDVSRMIPSGDLFDMNNQTGGLEIPQPLMPGNPLLTTIVGVAYNLDTFRGKTVTDKNDTSEEKTAKLAPWIWKQLTPAIAVGNYHFNRSVDAIANATGKPIDLRLGEYTGIGRDGLPVQPGLAALQTVGIKARPIDLEMSEKISRAERERTIKELQAEIRQLNRLENRGAVTPEAAEQKRELQREKIQRLREGLTVDGEPVN